MFNYIFHPYLRWLRDRSESDRPDFNIDRDGPLSQNARRSLQSTFPYQNSMRCFSRLRRPALSTLWLNSRVRFRAFA